MAGATRLHLSAIDGSLKSESDAQLLAQSGSDPARFGEFYDRHYERLVTFFYRRVACAQTAADLTSETFAQAFLSRSRFRDQGVPAVAWLFTIAQRQLSRFYRREAVARRARQRLAIGRLELSDVDIDEVQRLADAERLSRQVAAGLQRLSPTVREAVRMRVMSDLPFREVAARLGCSEGAARVRVSRGLAQLAEALEAE